MRLRILVVAASVAAGLALGSAPARAQSSDDTSRNAARQLGYAGVEAYEAGDFALAGEKLDKAFAVLKAPSLGLWSARARAKQGKLIQAAERYVEVTRLRIVGGDVAVQKKAQADAQQELEATQAQIPTVIVRVSGADLNDLKLSIDGAEVSSQLVGEAIPVNPGAHIVVAESGGARAQGQFSLQPKEQKQVVLELRNGAPVGAAAAAPARTDQAKPPPPDASGSGAGNARKTWSWVAIGAGGAGLLVGGVTAGMALSKKGSLDDEPGCADKVCPNDKSDDVNAYNTLRTVSSVGFIAGGVLATAGVVMLLTAPKSQASTALFVSPTSVQLRGRF